jgi:NAD+ kinase
MQNIGLVVKDDPEANKTADQLQSWLIDRGLQVVRQQSCKACLKDSTSSPPEPVPNDLDCVFVLGGDGTFLSALRWLGEHTVPVHGVKFGNVGFLAETSSDGLFETAEAILAGRFNIARRTRLEVSVWRNQQRVAHELVLNDIVINKGALARLANIEAYIDDHYLTTFKADGLILATPTGSTAYSLAAGGPIIHPAVPGILMTPICPFTLTNRPLIVPEEANIELRLGAKSSDIMLTFDGQAGLEISEQDTILARKGACPVHMITLPDQHYFDVLKAKLRWSGGRV